MARARRIRTQPSLLDYMRALSTCNALKEGFPNVEYYADGRVSWNPEKDKAWQRYWQAKAIVRQFEEVGDE